MSLDTDVKLHFIDCIYTRICIYLLNFGWQSVDLDVAATCIWACNLQMVTSLTLSITSAKRHFTKLWLRALVVSMKGMMDMTTCLGIPRLFRFVG